LRSLRNAEARSLALTLASCRHATC